MMVVWSGSWLVGWTGRQAVVVAVAVYSEAARSATPSKFAPVCGFYVQFFTLIPNVTRPDQPAALYQQKTLLAAHYLLLLLFLGRHTAGQSGGDDALHILNWAKTAADG